MRPNNDLIMDAVDGTTSPSSLPQWAQMIVRSSFQAVTTGTLAGALQLQGSNDMAIGLPPGQFVPTHWNNIGSSVSVSSAGTYLIPLTELCYEYVKVVYTNSSGTGNITIRMKSQAL